MTKITVLGDRNEEWVTHRALDAALRQLPAGIAAEWVATERGWHGASDGLWIAPGSPYRDDDAVLAAIAHARATGTPLLGTCGGFQYILLSLAGGTMADHAETTPAAAAPLIAPIAGPRLDGAWRTIVPVPGTELATLLGATPFAGLFFCGYAPTADAERAATAAGARIAARADGLGAVALEVPDARAFTMATLFHPQIGALDGEPLSPLIAAFAAAARAHARAHAQAAAAPR